MNIGDRISMSLTDNRKTGPPGQGETGSEKTDSDEGCLDPTKGCTRKGKNTVESDVWHKIC